MKLMTYNLLNGGENGIEKVYKVIESINPDFLTINEANTFADNDHAILKHISELGQFQSSHLALSGEYDYHVAVFSKKPWKEITEVKPLMRACVLTLFDSTIGPLSIGGLHFTPYTEALRMPEIELVTTTQSTYTHKVLMGDMNSLTEEDGYLEDITKNFNEMQTKKFTEDGHLVFDAMKLLKSKGYIDPAVELGKNKIYTAPTSINEFGAHSNMRLDYILTSPSLRQYWTKYEVVKNELTEMASDHYPVVLTVEGIEII